MVTHLFLDQVGEHFAVRSGLEKTALVLQVVAQQIRVDDIPVMGQCEITRVMMEQKRLYILRSAATGRRITDMTDGHIARKICQLSFVEHLRNKSFAPDTPHRPFLRNAYDTAPLLPAVLQGVESVIGQAGRVGHSHDAENAALLVQLPVADRLHHALFVHRNLFDYFFQTGQDLLVSLAHLTQVTTETVLV